MKKRDYGFWGLSPLLIFLILYVGSLIVFTIKGSKNPSSFMPREVAILIALLFAIVFFEPKAKFQKKLDIYLNNAGTSGVMNLSLIVMMAGGFASAVQASGGQTSIVNLGISLIPSKFLIPGVFLISGIISLCIGTSMGTIVTMLPVTFALVNAAHLNPGMAGAAVITGSYFGDGLSMIGGTTISAAAGVNANMKDKFIWQLKLAVPSALLTTIIYILFSFGGRAGGNVHAGSFNLLTISPYIVVLILAVIGLNVAAVLAIGTILAGIIGICTGTANFFDICKAIGVGMEGMFWLAVFSMMVTGVVALMRHYGGIDWLVKTIKKHIKSKRSCEALIGILTFLVSAAIVNNNIAVLIAAPIAKELGDKYGVSHKVLSAIMCIFAVVATMLIPQGAAVMMTLQQAKNVISYLDLLKYMIYPLVLVVITFIVVFFSRKKGVNN